MRRTVAVIPARGGSKGIPLKNIKPMLKKPLIQYTIEAALHAGTITEVYVSTDHRQIAEIAGSLGAKIIERPAELAGDTVSTYDVIKHAEGILGSPDVIVVLQPTSPLRGPAHIDEAVGLLDSDTDTVVGVSELKKYIWTFNGRYGTPTFKERLPRQLMEKSFAENGSIYVTRSKVYRDNDYKLGMGISSKGSVRLYMMEDKHSVEIDSEFDWLLVESFLEMDEEKN